MNLSVQHLSDEAVAAFADGMLGAGARHRASRHIECCPDCARAIAEHREAASVLRTAPAPVTPAGLLDRLRAVPTTTPLRPVVMSLAPDGSAVFPAFGTSGALSNPAANQMILRASAGLLTAAGRRVGRRRVRRIA